MHVVVGLPKPGRRKSSLLIRCRCHSNGARRHRRTFSDARSRTRNCVVPLLAAQPSSRLSPVPLLPTRSTTRLRGKPATGPSQRQRPEYRTESHQKRTAGRTGFRERLCCLERRQRIADDLGLSHSKRLGSRKRKPTNNIPVNKRFSSPAKSRWSCYGPLTACF